MLRHPYSLLCLAALAYLTSCSALFGYDIQLQGGWDQAEGDDRLYFSSRRIEGLGTGLNAMVIPAAWKDQPTVEVARGVEELAQSIDLQWISGRENLPEAVRESPGILPVTTHWSAEPKAWVSVQQRAWRLNLEEQPRTPKLGKYEYDDIHERLLNGQDAYVLVPHGRFLKSGFDVFAASGPPLMWVRLGTVNPKSGEGPLAWALTRSLGAVAYGLDTVAAFTVVSLVAVVSPLSGQLFLVPLTEAIPSTPW